MATKIQDPTVGATLQRLFSIQGRFQPALEEFVVPTVRIADLSLAAAPPVRRKASCTLFEAAVAAQFPTIRIEAIPGTFAVIRRMTLLISGAAAVNVSAGFRGNAATIAALPTQQSKAFTDGRLLAGSPSGAQAPSVVVTTGTQAAALASTQWAARIPATGLQTFDNLDWVVGGYAALFGFIELQLATANITLNGSIEWEEYSLV